MRLVWHIVAKDVRRLALPVSVWIVAMMAAVIWLRVRSWPGEAADVVGATNWIRSISAFSRFMAWLGGAGAILLAGQWVLEDRVTGSDSWWMTRPISGRRLLAAKALGAFLCLVVAPTLALLAVWIGCGLTWFEIVVAARSGAVMFACLVLGALALASLVENIGEHLFAVLAAWGVGLCVLMALPPTWLAMKASEEVVLGRQVLVALLPAPVLAFVLVHQFLTRRSWRWWNVLVLLALAMMGLRWAWRWDLSGVAPTLVQAWLPEERVPGAIGHGMSEIRIRSDPGDVTRVWVESGPRQADGTRLVPWSAVGIIRFADGRRADAVLSWAPGCGDETVLQDAGFSADGASVRWPMTVRLVQPLDPRPDWAGADFDGSFRIMRLRSRIIAEVPLRPGATWADGARALRVVGWSRSGALLEEREANPDARHDYFLLVNRRLGQAQAMGMRELGSATLSGVGLRLRVVETAAAIVDGWDGAVLIKVRLEPEARFSRPVAEKITLPARREATP